MLARIALFAVLLGIAFFSGKYIEMHPMEFDELESATDYLPGNQEIVCLLNPLVSSLTKVSGQKVTSRKLFEQSHIKLLQEYHRARNFQVLKAEAKIPQKPLLFFCYHLTYRHRFFSDTDDESLIC